MTVTVRNRSRALATAGMAVVVVGLAGCEGDGQSGIPTETPEPPATSSVEPAPVTTEPPAPPVPVGDVPGNARAVAALQEWVSDLVDGGDVTAACWTIAPDRTAAMYADVEAITAAVQRPGRDGQYAVTWSGGGTDVSVLRGEIESGYACPFVYPTGEDPYTEVDAVYAVERFLARGAGEPVHPDDTEDRYPLVCDARAIWDPYGTGAPTVPPLVAETDPVGDVTAFDVDSAWLWQMDEVYGAVTVPVVEDGVSRNLEVLVTTGPNGYCLGEVN